MERKGRLTDGIGLVVRGELLEIRRWVRPLADERDADFEFLPRPDGGGGGQRGKMDEGRSDDIGALHGRGQAGEWSEGVFLFRDLFRKEKRWGCLGVCCFWKLEIGSV